tara:strand:+ start:572 stop:922 length:351 start_codon:yes stop_codon:yes gene_type:complete
VVCEPIGITTLQTKAPNRCHPIDAPPLKTPLIPVTSSVIAALGFDAAGCLADALDAVAVDGTGPGPPIHLHPTIHRSEAAIRGAGICNRLGARAAAQTDQERKMKGEVTAWDSKDG